MFMLSLVWDQNTENQNYGLSKIKFLFQEAFSERMLKSKKLSSEPSKTSNNYGSYTNYARESPRLTAASKRRDCRKSNDSDISSDTDSGFPASHPASDTNPAGSSAPKSPFACEGFLPAQPRKSSVTINQLDTASPSRSRFDDVGPFKKSFLVSGSENDVCEEATENVPSQDGANEEITSDVLAQIEVCAKV